MRIAGIILLSLGVIAVLVSLFFANEHWEGRRLISASAPLLGGLGAVLLMANKRARMKKKEREGFEGDHF